MIKSHSFLLRAGIMVPVFYYGSLIIGSLFYPGYSHVTQYASELGSASAKFPYIFNVSIMVMGIASILASIGFYKALTFISGKKVWASIVGILIGLFGLSMIMGGLFPMPDMRHGAYGIGVGIHLVPAILAGLLWKHVQYRSLAVFLLINTGFMLVLFSIMMGIGQLVTLANVGIFQRTYSLSLFPWIAVTSYWFIKKMKAHETNV